MITESFKRDTSGPGEAFQTNRIPLALIGVGIAWLLANNTGLAKRVVQDERVQAARRRIGETAGDLGMGGEAKGERDAAQSGHILRPSGEPALPTSDAGRTDGWVHQATGAARGAISSVRDAGSAVLDRASRYTEYVGGAGNLAKRAGDPWLIGVVGLVAGAVIAALLPPTKLEGEFIGKSRDELWNKATELAHEAAGCVRNLAEPANQASTHRAPEA